MFFVEGLTSSGKLVLVNPDQILYVGPSSRGEKSILMMTHSQQLQVDQDIDTVKRRFEDYLKDMGDRDNRDPSATEEPDSNSRQAH